MVEIRDELEKAWKEIKDAKLVGCVREAMLVGFVVCPLIELCPHVPKKDIGNALRNDISAARLSYYDDDQKILENIKDVMKVLEEAKEITAKCPLNKLIKGEYP